MRARAIKAMLIALGVLLVQWVLFPYLATKRQVFLPSAELSRTTDGTLMVMYRSVGLRTIGPRSPEAERSTLKLFGVTEGSLVTRPIPDWAATPSGFPKDARVDSSTATGWPFAMIRNCWIELPGNVGTAGNSGASTAQYQDYGSMLVAGAKVPSDPVWSGLSINLAFWWLLAFAVLSIPLRPWLRRRKGRCPKCAYDLKADFTPGCPECGWGRDAAQPAPTASERVLADTES